MERRITALVRSNYPRFEITPFTTEAIAKKPVVLIGTFTAINNAAIVGGARDVYRVCLALADLRTGTIISKGATRALPDGIDPTPTAFFADSPVLVRDPATEAYIKNCQASRLGDPIDPVYADRIQVAVHVNNGIQAYNARNYAEALEQYEKARQAPGGEQLRVFNGLILQTGSCIAARRLASPLDASWISASSSQRLSVKFLFAPNSARFGSDREIAAEYNSWLPEIAARTIKADKCLEVVGHTSATGSAGVNDRISLQRAEYVRGRLRAASPGASSTRFTAKGAGSGELIVGTGRDDDSDALDRRVEFKASPCAAPIARTDKVQKAARATSARTVSKASYKRRAEGSDGSTGLPRGVETEIKKYLNSSDLKELLAD